MGLKKRAYSVLIVSSSLKFITAIRPLLPESKYTPITAVGSLAEGKRRLIEREYDFVIINAPLPDGGGDTLAIDVCEKKGSVALMLLRQDVRDEVEERVSEYGVFTLGKPVPREVFLAALGWMAGTRERLRRSEKKTQSLETRMEEIRIVNRAKWMLISELKLDEPEAHRYIEKQAMDRCVSKREIAEEIIKTYM